MIIIQSIEIYNFRSIVRFDKKVNPNSLNIIVGQNDIGKSNFLKALNLFFNNETEIGSPYRFNDDFSKYAKVPNKKAPEIKIKIQFKTPSRFRQNEPLIWTKIWRKYGLHKDEIKKVDGTIPSRKGGALQWLNKVKFKYVPAIRGKEYFNYLMGDLHDALSEINPSAFNEASSQFIGGLKSQVEELVSSISNELGYSSEIGMPTDFKMLFSTLDFSLDKSGAIISLNKRGDGIKAQHIPIILKFIASHYKSIKGRARIQPDTIWGFEEPENNMEMSNAFKLGKIFASFSKDIQIFINTHSPAFYTLAKENDKVTNLYIVKSENEKSGTKLFPVEASNTEILDNEVGILSLISDHIKKEVDLRIQAEKKADELLTLKNSTKYLILSEDEDLTYIKKICQFQGFEDDITEYVSYESRSNLLAAMQSCKITLSDKPDLTDIVFHRNSDMYDGDEPDKERVEKRLISLNKSKKIKHHLFKTDYYDLESYFINAEHIKSLIPSLTLEEIETLIQESTAETQDKSIDKLYHRIEATRKIFESKGELFKFSTAKEIKNVKDLYESNPKRYRYCKTTLGVLKAKLQQVNGNLDLLQDSGKIMIPRLKAILD